MESEKTKILCLAFWTPPASRPRAIMAGKIIPEMVQRGIEPILLTYKKKETWNAGVSAIFISEFKAGGFWQKIPLLRNFITAAMEWLYYEKLYKKARGIVIKEKPVAAISFSNPQASNILGAMLKKRLRLPFVSHFSDPWLDNPYKKFSFFGQFKVKWLEKFIVKMSDFVVFTSNEAAELVMKKYPADWRKKVRIIPHCFDKKDYPPSAAAKSGNPNSNFVISHIGAFYKKRMPEPLFAAARKIIDRNKTLETRLKICLVGGVNDYTDFGQAELLKLAEKYKLTEIIDVLPTVSYKESLKLMAESDCLIVIDAPFEGSPFLPSKVVDYAGSQRPIIGITSKNSPTEKFLVKLGFNSFQHNETEKIAEEIEAIAESGNKMNTDKKFLINFEVSAVAQKWLGLVEKIANEKRN